MAIYLLPLEVFAEDLLHNFALGGINPNLLLPPSVRALLDSTIAEWGHSSCLVARGGLLLPGSFQLQDDAQSLVAVDQLHHSVN